MTTDNDKAPEWMTELWLRTMAGADELIRSPMASEILRLRAELAKRTAFIASLPNLKEAGEMCKQAAAELATLTAELATLREHADHDAGEILRLGGELAKVTAERDALHKSYVATVDERDAALACKGCGGTVSHHLAPDQGGCPGRFVIDGVPMVPVAHVEAARAEVERLTKERDACCDDYQTEAARAEAAIRDRNEFAASEVVKCAHDWLREVPFSALTVFASHRAAELRKAAPSTEGQPSILPLVRADGRTLRVVAIAGGAHPDDRRDGFPAELRLELGDVSRRHSCRYVRQAEGVSEGVSAGGCKAAGAAAPAEPNLLDKLHAAYRAHDEAVARLQSRRATPAADARQPDDAAKLAEVEKREADGIKLFDDLLATERAKVATMSIELDGMRNRIAASEKAKVHAERRVLECHDWYGRRWSRLRELMPMGSEMEKLACDVIANGHLMTDAAERAGGAS